MSQGKGKWGGKENVWAYGESRIRGSEGEEGGVDRFSKQRHQGRLNLSTPKYDKKGV